MMTQHPRIPATVMRTIPAGLFQRGSNASPDEQPVTMLEMDAFQIGRDPVTNGQFAQFIEDGGYEAASLWTPLGWDFVQTHGIVAPNYWDDDVWAEDPEVPVTGVSWWEALAFGRWASMTLPTEAQWEYACRGSSGNTYPWGEDLPEPTLANYAPEGEPLERRPTRPDVYPSNVSEFGCRDLAGNFAEWCLDNYAVGYRTQPAKNPLYFTDEADNHVVRGGCGLHDEDYLRCSARDHYHPGLRDNLIGFRCARPIQEADV